MTAKGQLYKALSESLPFAQIQNLIEGVEIVSKSPYSNSFYSSNEIGWNYKPDGSFRISDHWNFYSRGETHCETSNDVEENCWSVGVYSAETGKYTILKSFTKEYGRLNALRIEREERKRIFTTMRQNRIAQIFAQKNREKEAAKRAEKIKNANRNSGAAIWIEVNVNVWSGTGRRVKFAGIETLVGMLAWESKTGNSFLIKLENGHTREIRKYNSYKELSRKPRAKKYEAAA